MKSPLLLVLTALALTTASHAVAEPGDGPLISTTCSYAQLESALKVQAPNLADELASRPAAQAKLAEFIAMPVDQRKQQLQDTLDRNPQWRSTIEEKRNTPEGQEKIAMLARIAETCHDY
jgi:hemophore-related protein